ncbi:ketopantoate reductase family protein [Nocardioides sp. B-3]|uniref:ketopantoate reductase family protein n=1 Tax=Nocardioides sp. B-3 TaxID=2895565 RepID=UPI003FA61359
MQRDSSPRNGPTSWRGSDASCCSTRATGWTRPSGRATRPRSWRSARSTRACRCLRRAASQSSRQPTTRCGEARSCVGETTSPPGGGSTRQSLQRGTGDSEVDYLHGEIVLLGRLHDIRTPVNAAIVAATRDLTANDGTPRSLDARTVLDELAPK